MKLLPVLTFSAAALFLSSTSALASSMTFDFTNIDSSDIVYGTDGSYADSINMSQNNIDLSITAASSTSPQNSTDPVWTDVTDPYGISITDNGLGVKSHLWDNPELDGATQLESLLFSFTPTIDLVSITLEHFYNSEWIIAEYFFNDDFNLTVDGVLKLTDVGDTSSYFSPITFAINETGNEFRIWADHFTDDFRIASFEIAATPLPAGVWLFGTAILGLVGIRRRANKTI